MCLCSCPRTIKVTANASAVSGCLKLPASCLLPSSLSLCKIKSMQCSCSCSKLRLEEAGTINCSLPWTAIVLLLCVVGVCGFSDACLGETGSHFSPLFLHLQMDTNTHTEEKLILFSHMNAVCLLLCHFSSSFIALIFFLNIPLALPHPVYSTKKCFDLLT